MSRIQQVIDTLEAERDELRERLAWLDKQLGEFQEHQDGSDTAAPPRSNRRATARRASARRASARSLKTDAKANVVEFLIKHPGSTAGEIAKGLNLSRGTVSGHLTSLARAGEITKAARGYRAVE